ncbi:MAG: DUF4351 domain-containing protein [Candidatus Accumulibacter sp.]|nr:DUF4351 domain-containing protein [Accumulibacter sp.]
MTCQRDRSNPEGFTERLIHLSPDEHKEKMMSIAEQLERIGWEKGHMRGREEGEAAVLARSLSRRFGPLPEWARERLRRGDAAQLETRADAALEVASLEEVLGAPPGSH